jgi:tetratricopeptide (TPR) repeat protein
LKNKTSSARALAALRALVCATVAASVASGQVTMSPAVETLYDSGSYGAAAKALQPAIERTPNDSSLHYRLGRCYYEMRDFDHAISSWERAVTIDSSSSKYHDWLGRAYGRKADQDSHTKMASALALARKTHHEFETAVQLDIRNIQAQRDLIDFMASAPRDLGGGEENAMSQIRALSAVDSLEGMLALADLYAMRKKFDQSGEQYQKILESSPSRVDPYFEASDYYRDRSDGERMAQAVEAAIKVAPSDRRLNYYRGVALVLQNKDLETAEKNLHTYIDAVPDNSELPSHSSAHEYLGKLYENLGRPDAAVAQYEAALALDPQNKALREALKRLEKR